MWRWGTQLSVSLEEPWQSGRSFCFLPLGGDDARAEPGAVIPQGCVALLDMDARARGAAHELGCVADVFRRGARAPEASCKSEPLHSFFLRPSIKCDE